MSETESNRDQYCRNCGAELREGTTFCVSCGVPLIQRQEVPNPAQPESTTEIPSTIETLSDSHTGSRSDQVQGTGGLFSGSSSASGRGAVKQLLDKVITWFRDLSSIPKLIVVGLALLIPLILLSPVVQVVAIFALAASIIILFFQAAYRKPIRAWVVAAVSSLVLILVFGGVSGTIYGTSFLGGFSGGNEVAEDSPVPANTIEDQGSDQSIASSGDWDSIGAYVDDMVDSEEKVDDISDDTAETLELSQDGYITDSEAVYRLSDARENLDTHRDYFRGTVPPEGFEQYHRLTLAGWDLYAEGLSNMEEGASSYDTARIVDGYETVVEGVEMLDKANQYIPEGIVQEEAL